MPVVKCMKCGADIPDNAAFCPACGAPKEEVKKTPQPVQPSPQPKQTQTIPITSQKIKKTISPMEGLFNMFFSKTAIIIGVALGILFAWIGLIVRVFAAGSSNIAVLLSSMGFAGIGLLLLGGGIWNKKINSYARLAMVLIGGFLVVNGVSVLNLAYNYSGFV